MDQQEPHFLEIGQGEMRRRIAFRFDEGASDDSPVVVFLPGFLSDMAGSKAQVLAEQVPLFGGAMMRFDYSGHGLSEGTVESACIGDWLAEARAVLERVGQRPVILVGSSMGGWIALLLARALAERGDGRLKGLVLIAPAWDMTEKLMWDEMSEDVRRTVMEEGVYFAPSNYDAPYPITKRLIEEGRNHLLAAGKIPVNAPVRILQGMRDEDVPWKHGRALVDLLAGDDVDLTLIKAGDHRLSGPEDLDRLVRTVAGLLSPLLPKS